MNKNTILAATIGIFLGFGAAFSFSGEAAKTPEYKLIKVQSMGHAESTINSMAKEGWRLHSLPMTAVIIMYKE